MPDFALDRFSQGIDHEDTLIDDYCPAHDCDRPCIECDIEELFGGKK